MKEETKEQKEQREEQMKLLRSPVFSPIELPLMNTRFHDFKEIDNEQIFTFKSFKKRLAYNQLYYNTLSTDEFFNENVPSPDEILYLFENNYTLSSIFKYLCNSFGTKVKEGEWKINFKRFFSAFHTNFDPQLNKFSNFCFKNASIANLARASQIGAFESSNDILIAVNAVICLYSKTTLLFFFAYFNANVIQEYYPSKPDLSLSLVPQTYKIYKSIIKEVEKKDHFHSDIKPYGQKLNSENPTHSLIKEAATTSILAPQLSEQVINSRVIDSFIVDKMIDIFGEFKYNEDGVNKHVNYVQPTLNNTPIKGQYVQYKQDIVMKDNKENKPENNQIFPDVKAPIIVPTFVSQVLANQLKINVSASKVAISRNEALSVNKNWLEVFGLLYDPQQTEKHKNYVFLIPFLGNKSISQYAELAMKTYTKGVYNDKWLTGKQKLMKSIPMNVSNNVLWLGLLMSDRSIIGQDIPSNMFIVSAQDDPLMYFKSCMATNLAYLFYNPGYKKTLIQERLSWCTFTSDMIQTAHTEDELKKLLIKPINPKLLLANQIEIISIVLTCMKIPFFIKSVDQGLDKQFYSLTNLSVAELTWWFGNQIKDKLETYHNRLFEYNERFESPTFHNLVTIDQYVDRILSFLHK